MIYKPEHVTDLKAEPLQAEVLKVTTPTRRP
jgi:hypothetical protein